MLLHFHIVRVEAKAKKPSKQWPFFTNNPDSRMQTLKCCNGYSRDRKNQTSLSSGSTFVSLTAASRSQQTPMPKASTSNPLHLSHLVVNTARYGSFPKYAEPQYGPQNNITLVIGTPKNVSLIFEKPHVVFWPLLVHLHISSPCLVVIVFAQACGSVQFLPATHPGDAQ